MREVKEMAGNGLKFHFLSIDWLENVEKKGHMLKNRGKTEKQENVQNTGKNRKTGLVETL